MKTDWEAVVRDLKLTANIGQTETICEAIKRHTRRTEEDLPKEGVYLVRFPLHDWFMAKFFHGRLVSWACWFGRQNAFPESINNRPEDFALDLEIGPEVVPPGKEK